MSLLNPSKLYSQEAKAFFTHRPCEQGHISWRYVSDGSCIECAKQHASNWRKNNPERVRAYKAKRRAVKLERIPPWADLKAIRVFYEACPKGHHVDHYYPLRSETCSGLHVLENLRHIPASENLSKGNKMPEEFY